MTMLETREQDRPLGAAEGEAIHHYFAFGLLIRSDLEIPEIEPHPPGAPDLIIRRGRLGRPLPVGATCFEFSEREQYLGWPAVGHFLIRDGREIVAEAGPDIAERFLNLALLGPVMATVLQLRGYLVLHGSAVELDGAAAIFLGDKEAGKSTTAAAFAAAGRPLLTDDVVAIDMAAAGGPTLIPGYPQMKLSASAVAEFGEIDASRLPSPHPSFAKERLRLEGPFATGPVKLAAAYVLARGASATFTAFAPLEAMKALMRFSYSTRFGDRLIRGAAAADHMRHCAKLAGVVPVGRLETPSSLARLGEVVECVERHVRI